jgi:hypothetical protein
MKMFFAFYDSHFDAEIQAQTYADEALVHAGAIKKQITSRIVDTRSSSPLKTYWNSPTTIECVTVDGDTKKESLLNATELQDIDQMVDRL